ncbi:GNAT family N-acetyltransferase [uncultured Draconibacterium sp.]|uniref:GNAT family N-acetyltransferase n=1 Tax=uncultured Draconibacterium sp. TaxID=1573823 RepID=UPI0032611109
MTSYKTFETERLILRPCVEQDAKFIYRLLNTPKWLEFIGNRNVNSEKEAAKYILEKMYPQLQNLGFGNYVVQRKSDNSKLGTCGIFDREGMEGLDIGFAFLPEYEKKGYAYEAARRLLQAAFEDFNLKTVKAITTQNNGYSQKLLEKLGMQNMGSAFLDGDPEELYLYELNQKQYHQQGMQALLLNEFVLAEGAINERIRRSSLSLHPILANAPLIYGETKEPMSEIYRGYINIAQKAKTPICVYTPSWRANAERVKQAKVLESINRDACKFMQNIKNEFIGFEHQVKIGGLFGPKNDCYKPEEALSAEEAEQFHAWQINELAQSGVDFLVPETVPALSEALGIARCAAKTGTPYMIGFVINRNGKILDGTTLNKAIESIDWQVEVPPIGYAINCAHPSFFNPEQLDSESLSRIIAYNANASSLDHCDLDNADCLHTDNLEEWGEIMLTLNKKYGINILGGCCGTNDAHIQYLIDNY